MRLSKTVSARTVILLCERDLPPLDGALDWLQIEELHDRGADHENDAKKFGQLVGAE